MLLAADIGNTNITFGLFDKENLLDTFRLSSDKQMPQEEYEVLIRSLFKDYEVQACIIASVADELNLVLKQAIDNVFNISSILLSADSNLGIKINLKNPKRAGMDRIANAYGAYNLYPKPAIVADFGTANTFDIVDKNGDFIGGVIMPGINLQLQVLSKGTSKLPKIEVKEVEKAIGDNTEDAILSGVIRGTACAAEGLVAQCEQELGQKACLIATGGYSSLVSKYMCRKFDYINPNLTLEGLRYLYELNRGCGKSRKGVNIFDL